MSNNPNQDAVSGKSSAKSSKIKNLEDLIKAASSKREEDVNPERKLLFRPKIYESWKEGDTEDELEVRQRLLTDIAQKQMALADKKSFMTVDEDDEDDDAGEKKEINETLTRLKNRKHREAAFKKKIDMYELQMEEAKLRKEQEALDSERANPSKYGFFYGDGYYEGSGYFGIKEELIERLVEEGDEWGEKWLQKYPETFTEQWQRYFWPPKLLIKNKVFRTRGSYLDFPEVIADWPKPIDITYNRAKVEMLSSTLPIFTPNEDGELMEIGMVNEFLRKAEEAEAVAKAQEIEEAEEVKKQEELEVMAQEEILILGLGVGQTRQKSTGSIFGKRNRIGPKTELGAEDWYYDDELGEFFPKRYGFEVEYHFDGHYSVWRKKRKATKLSNFTSPYDYYWDVDTSSFLPKEEYKGIHTTDYDDTLGVYKLTKVVKQKGRNKRVVEQPDSDPEFRVIDYYYDENNAKWDLRKNAGDGAGDIAWDENGKRFARKAEGSSWRGLTGHSPDDYYFDDLAGKFIPKPPRQGNNFKYFFEDGIWRKLDSPKGQQSKKKIKSNDYFFDLLEGQFKLREIGRDAKYTFQKYAKIYFKALEPKSGLGPDDYYWDPRRKLFLPRNIRMEMLQNAKSGVPYIPEKGKPINVSQQEKFFWDTEEGEFFKKEAAEDYYYDNADGVWKSEKLKNKVRNRKYANDFYFDENKKTFLIKDSNAAEGAYKYDEKERVWKISGASTKTGNPRPKDFVFDANMQKWIAIQGDADTKKEDVDKKKDADKKKEDADKKKEDADKKKADADKKISTIKTPDDFWYSDAEGRFYPKTPADAANYNYSATEGVWKKKGVFGPPATGFLPKNFFFDDYKYCYKLKVAGMDSDYYYDKNNKIYRHITNTGKTRNGLAPSDYKWNNEIGLYILTKSYSKWSSTAASSTTNPSTTTTYTNPSATTTYTNPSATTTTTKGKK